MRLLVSTKKHNQDLNNDSQKTWLHNGLKGCIATLTISLGLTIFYTTSPAFLP